MADRKLRRLALGK